MKPKLLIVLAVGLLLGADTGKDDAKKDQDKLQGEWVLASATRDGMEAPEEFIKSLKRSVKGDEYTVTRDGETILKGKFKLDPTKKPKTIDVTAKDQNGNEMSIAGIYEIEGDSFKLCYSGPGMERPKTFASEAGSGISLAVWKRAKK
jgi:uncharacterized protein (TIGR03067 family)